MRADHFLPGRVIRAGLLVPGLFAAVVCQAQGASDYLAGKALFERHWVSPPASTAASDGLGPYYNASSCDTCHNDGGAGQIADFNASPALVVHFMDEDSRANFGQQWQPHAVRGLVKEKFSIGLTRQYSWFEYPDGSRVQLTAPVVSTYEVDEKLIPQNTVISLRRAPDLHGSALLGSVILPPGAEGRFGWQAEQQSLEHQLATALSSDLGLGNPVLTSSAGDCAQQQMACRDLALITLTGSEPEISSAIFDLLLAYLNGLSAPEVSPADDADQQRSRFIQLGCAACHIESLNLENGERINAFTDLKLHDMGQGLSDLSLNNQLIATRWRTPPLWSIAEALDSGNAVFLHDGRADTLEQAILWHGGEALAARDAFAELNRAQRMAFEAWLAGL